MTTDLDPSMVTPTDRDPYDTLRDQLVEAAQAAEPRRARVLRWISRHTAIALIAGTAVTATATAAVVTGLRGTPSPPLSGSLISPPGTTEHEGGRYRIAMSPLISVGSTGWCLSQTMLPGDPDSRQSGSSCFGIPLGRYSEINGGVAIGQHDTMAYSVVTDRVAGVRLPDGHVILSRAEPALPQGFRLIVVQSGDPTHGLVFDNRDLDRWRFVDGTGAVVGRPGETERAGTDELVAAQPSRRIRGVIPRDAPCRISLTSGGWPGERRSLRTEVLRRTPEPVDGATGRPFMACASVTAGPRIDEPKVSVLLDAASPGRRPAPLPGMRGPDDGSIVQVASVGLPVGSSWDKPQYATAQRRGNAWIVVQGKTPEVQRELLERVTVDLNL